MVRPIVLLDAPSNLGLRPPAPGSVPGCYKLAGALRDKRLLERLTALEGGVVVPPRYVPDWTPGAGVRNGRAIADYAQVRISDRVRPADPAIVVRSYRAGYGIGPVVSASGAWPARLRRGASACFPAS